MPHQCSDVRSTFIRNLDRIQLCRTRAAMRSVRLSLSPAGIGSMVLWFCGDRSLVTPHSLLIYDKLTMSGAHCTERIEDWGSNEYTSATLAGNPEQPSPEGACRKYIGRGQTAKRGQAEFHAYVIPSSTIQSASIRTRRPELQHRSESEFEFTTIGDRDARSQWALCTVPGQAKAKAKAKIRARVVDLDLRGPTSKATRPGARPPSHTSIHTRRSGSHDGRGPTLTPSAKAVTGTP